MNLLVLLIACRGCGSADTALDSADTVISDDVWQRRSLFYLQEGRVCMSESGVTQQVDGEPVGCLVDGLCEDADYPLCRHVELAEDGTDPTRFYPPLEFPYSPKDQNNSGYGIRYVPLCEDGSGDHEYSLGIGEGTPPTCAESEFIRCANGTRPQYYTKAGSTDGWIIWAGGGGFSLNQIYDIWLKAHIETGSFGEGVVPASQRASLSGIFSDTEGGSAFADYSRVYVEKCTPDRWLGTTEIDATSPRADCSEIAEDCTGSLEPPLSDEEHTYTTFLHGDRIVRAVLQDLSDGPDLYDDYDSGAPVSVISLPALADADQVLLTCHSNGCNGLHMTGDRRAGMIEDIADGVDVRFVFNSFFSASLEGEYTIDETSTDGAIFADRSWYDHVTAGTSIARGDSGGGMPMSTFAYEAGWQAQILSMYGAILDESCAEYHSDDPTLCYDTMHVVANHLSRPFFYSFAQRDNDISNGVPATAPYCQGADDLEYCEFAGVNRAWQQLIRKQAADLYSLAGTDRCEADSEGAAPYDEVFLWSPAWDSHAGWNSDVVVGLEMGLSEEKTVTMRSAVWAWASGAVSRAICLEADPDVAESATNEALGLPDCVGAYKKPD